jgi:hypothetical protein
MFVEIRDDVIWAKHLKSSPELYNAILRLDEEEIISLSVDGIVGKWAKMKTGKDGRPTQGIKPVGAMAEVWKRMQARRGEMVSLNRPDEEADPWLKMADTTFDEWLSAEDEEAYGALQPL